MRIISALFDARGYSKLADNLARSARRLGYRITVYPVTEDPISEYVNEGKYFAPCAFKPHLILKALDDTKEDIIWMDSDCLIRKPIDDILGEADVAVTLRRGKGLRDVYDGYLNAGVIAFRNNGAAREFIRKWIQHLPGSRADQDALNKTLLDFTLFEKYNELVDCGFARVIVRSCDEYNFFYFPEPTEAKVYHIKGSLRGQYYASCVKEVLGQ